MADDPFQAVLDKIVELDAESARLKAWVNEGDKIAGKEPRFADISAAYSPGGSGAGLSRGVAKRWQPGDFFNKPFQAAARTILLDRYAQAGNQPSPATVDEIHEALSQGSFNFGTSGAEAQQHSLRTSLGKNSATFVRLPNSDMFGLCEWYGKKLGRPRKTTNGSASAAPETDGEEAAAEPPAATETAQEPEGRETP
jgi:hypothetical protein